ncbi:sensor domain-containing diguanylate cyclase [Candidatus Chordibacter forsetii]|uniref:sensor domain-containing diguanylate cyclase n=1 Tax=Candidatus Chordibacter forsetii TaxID=3381758 RepID=UPI00389A8909
MFSDFIDIVKNKTTLLILLVIGVLVSVYAGKLVYNRETDAIHLSFRRDFSDKVQALSRELFLMVEVVYGVKNLYDCSDNVDYDEFITNVHSFLTRHGDKIQALSWNPRETTESIPVFLESIRSLSPDFKEFEISERNEQGLLVKAKLDRESYFPIAFIEPMIGNEVAHGFDIASDPERYETIKSAMKTGEIHATPTIDLVQHRGKGVLVIAPIYKGKPKTLEKRIEQLDGVVVGVFNVNRMVDKALRSTAAQNLTIEILEGEFPAKLKPKPGVLSKASIIEMPTGNSFKSIYSSSEDESAIFPTLGDFGEFDTITFANRSWGIKGTPFQDYVEQRRTFAPLLVSIFGTFLCVTTFGYLFRILVVQEKLKALTMLDSLTKVANKRGIIDCLNYEWKRCMRDTQSLSICMIDIDEFKKFNDTYGHVAGDRCLQEVAEALQKAATRSVDLIGRYGGEEFCLIMPNTNDPSMVAKSCLDNVADLHIPHSGSSSASYVSVSIGLATIVPQKDDSLTTFLKAADKALYEAKEFGRNQIVIAKEVEHGHALAGDVIKPGLRKSATRQPW